ncbi:MAG: hypothetical protein ERJ67_01810 [Aphanocapsa feldmannii 277cV]|uniref:Uncharacterized protein n=1 Tax=Aphanocapsa feldmannii 277cV TaxID=2507553 RepID=A0A524RQD4_9CHRO|nr:MAG: hypothetical protein ERJ67_01810 [Aphanocapsa feldmannii 277cV]
MGSAPEQLQQIIKGLVHAVLVPLADVGDAAQARGGQIRVPALPLPAVAGDEVIAAVAIASSNGVVATAATLATGGTFAISASGGAEADTTRGASAAVESLTESESSADPDNPLPLLMPSWQ